MLFNTPQFFPFFLLTLFGFYLISARRRGVWLLSASYIFYCFWDWRFTFLLLLSSTIDFVCSQEIQKAGRVSEPHLRKKVQKKFLLFSVVANLGTLSIFKYLNFFSDSVTQLLYSFGVQTHPIVLNIILPLGISFYTLQSMAYTIDVYRGKTEPVESYSKFLLFVSFFPQLIAGPIERANALIPQLTTLNGASREQVWFGLRLLLSGYIKKCLLGDTIAPIVDTAFASPAELSSIYLWEGALLFSLQIYFDFSGYSDIARGVASLFGINLTENFRLPLLSRNIREFWARWHITLSLWLKDYLYIPLGGNQRWFVPVILTFAISGLWHGANITFLLWGFFHGILLLLFRSWRKHFAPLPYAVGFMVTQVSVCTLFVLFRSPDLSTSLQYLKGMYLWRGSMDTNALMLIVTGFVFMVIAELPKGVSLKYLRWSALPYYLRYPYVGFSVLAILLKIWLSPLASPFIYFKF